MKHFVKPRKSACHCCGNRPNHRCCRNNQCHNCQQTARTYWPKINSLPYNWKHPRRKWQTCHNNSRYFLTVLVINM
ncbi:hypothetical protein Lal_00049347 [Lupinus albus]|nr:hypothetical protein Lal_00049347 [Lupinus albus]